MKSLEVTFFSQLEHGEMVQYIAISLQHGKTVHHLRVTSAEYENGGEDVILEIMRPPGDKNPPDLIPISAREIIIRPL